MVGRSEKASAAQRAIWSDPAKRAARIAAISRGMKARHAQRRVEATSEVEVPAWVKAAGLEKTYLSTAALKDEFAAARKCRRLKAERSL